MPMKRSRVRGRKLLQGGRRACPGQGAVVGGLMAPEARGGRSGEGQSVRTAARGLRSGPLLAARFSSSRGPRVRLQAGFSPKRGPGGGRDAGLRALRLESRLVSSCARAAAAPSRLLRVAVAFRRGAAGFYFWKPLLVFSSLLSTPCPLLGGTAQPPHYGRGREEFQQHPLWHREASGRRGVLTREELGEAQGGPEVW